MREAFVIDMLPWKSTIRALVDSANVLPQQGDIGVVLWKAIAKSLSPPQGPRLATCVTESAARQTALNQKRVIGSYSG